MVYVPIRKHVIKSDLNTKPGKKTVPYKRKKAAAVYMGQPANHRPVVLIQTTHKELATPKKAVPLKKQRQATLLINKKNSVQ